MDLPKLRNEILQIKETVEFEEAKLADSLRERDLESEDLL